MYAYAPVRSRPDDSLYPGKVTETTRLIRDGEKGGRWYGGGGRGRL